MISGIFKGIGLLIAGIFAVLSAFFLLVTKIIGDILNSVLSNATEKDKSTKVNVYLDNDSKADQDKMITTSDYDVFDISDDDEIRKLEKEIKTKEMKLKIKELDEKLKKKSRSSKKKWLLTGS